MDLDTAYSIAQPILLFLFFGLPAWLIFYPPGRLRKLPSSSRAILAILTGVACDSALIHGLVSPAIEFYHARELAYESAQGVTVFNDHHIFFIGNLSGSVIAF